MGVKVTRNTLKACVLSLFGAAVLCAPSDALARNLVVKLWRGETHAMILPDDVIMEIAKSLLPDIVAFYETEEGKEVTRRLEAEEGAAKRNEQKTA